MDSLLDEAWNGETTAMHTTTSRHPPFKKSMQCSASYSMQHSTSYSHSEPPKSCPLCKASGKDAKHFLSECKYLPDSDHHFILKACQITNILDEEHSKDDIPKASDEDLPRDTVAMRVNIRQSQ